MKWIRPCVCFGEAVELDPTYAGALTILVECCLTYISQGFGHRDDPQVSDLVQVAQKAVALAAG